MKVNKLIVLLFFPIMAQLIFSCCCCDDDATGYPSEGVPSIEGIELFLVDNSGPAPIIIPKNNSTIDSINQNAFGIEVQVIYSQFVNSFCAPTPSFDWFPSATACSCPNDEPNLPSIVFKNFKITTLSDFDSSKKAGDDITPYFKFYFQNDFSEINQDSINDVWYDRLMVLLEKPQIDSIFQFEVSFDVNDTLSIKDTTEQVFLF